GVRTPSVLAAGWRRVLGPWHAYLLVTEAIPDGVNLQAALARRLPARERRALLEAAGAAVRGVHDAGFFHADLHPANLVIEATAEGPRAHIVDLDRGEFPARLSEAQRRSNLRRLLRSWEKWRPDGRSPDARDAVAFLRAYCRGDGQAMRGLAAELGRARG